jgi:hypothetical protein
MCRSKLALAFALALSSAAAAFAAAPQPSGTIDCRVTMSRPEYALNFKSPYLRTDPAPHGIPVKTDMDGPCDSTGVVGGKAPITNVAVKLVGRFADGTTCDTLTSTPELEKIAFKIKWQGLNPAGNLRTVAKSLVRAATVAWDDASEALVFTTEPLNGGFGGSSATITLTLDPGSVVGNGGPCPSYSGLDYGSDGESSITIP